MVEKKIVFLISSSPFSTMNNYEALRASLSIFDHQVTIIWREEAVHFTKNSVEKTMTKPLLRVAKDMEIEMFVTNDDLKEKGIDQSHLEPNIKSIDYSDMISILVSADIVINF